uniref:EF-hand domain-containing protein n=1 Tax=Caenorhabditis japonica TaxID=281687 RepID=A0A8R1DH67_CAEJA
MTTMRVVYLFALGFALVVAQNDSFDLVDSNNDGKLSEKELVTFMKKRGRPDGQEYFQRFDLDRNGHLDISEFVPLVYEMSRRPVDMDYEFFKRMDLNDDGVVDKSEVETIRKENNDRIIDGILSIADVDHDGQLTYAEFKSHLSAPKRFTPEDEQRNHALQLLSFIDSNGDNKLSPAELYSFSQKTATNKVTKSDVQQIFATLDANQDGFLTESELVQLAQQFSTIGNVRSTIPKV